MRVHRDERRLDRSLWRTLGFNLVESSELFSHGRIGRALQVHINRSVDAQMIRTFTSHKIAELVLDIVGKVWRVRNVDAAFCRRQFQVGRFSRFCLIVRDCARLSHRLEHLIATRPGRFDIVKWIVSIGAANYPGEERRLGQRQIRYVFIKVSS